MKLNLTNHKLVIPTNHIGDPIKQMISSVIISMKKDPEIVNTYIKDIVNIKATNEHNIQYNNETSSTQEVLACTLHIKECLFNLDKK